jgi:hypothetical protein
MSVFRKVVLGSALALAMLCAVVFGQQPNPTLAPPINDMPSNVPYQPLTLSNSSHETSQIAQKYVKAKGEEEKEKLRKQLQELVNKQFDMQMGRQQKELEVLEKQLAQLRSVLKKRQESKKDIIDRRIDQLILDAEGLGWTAPASNTSPNSPWQPNDFTRPVQR